MIGIYAQAESFGEQVVDFFTGDAFVSAVGVIVGAIVLWMIIRSVGHRAVERLVKVKDRSVGPVAELERAQRAETLWSVLRKLMFLTLLAVTVLTLLAVMDVPIGPLLAASSIIGIAVGFGAQSLVKDIIAGYFILSENQYTLGDVVRIAGVAGAVTDIRARVTVLRDLEGNVHYVPNGLIEVTSNLTQEFAQVVVDVGIAYGEDVDRAIEVVGDEIARFAADEEWLPRFLDEPQLLGVNALGSWSVDLRVLFKVPPDDRWLVKREFLRRIKNRLDAEGIEIPFPYTTLVPGDPERWRSILSPAESGDG